MLNRQKKNDPKLAGSEDYDVNHPQNIAQPVYNSTADEKASADLPGIENLNHDSGLKDPLKEATNDLNDPSAQKNDESLHGQPSETDLGNGSSDEEDQEDEGLIRT
jgi:hypothetical protein